MLRFYKILPSIYLLLVLARNYSWEWLFLFLLHLAVRVTHHPILLAATRRKHFNVYCIADPCSFLSILISWRKEMKPGGPCFFRRLAGCIFSRFLDAAISSRRLAGCIFLDFSM